MKTLKKCFSLAGGRKSGLSFATFAICAIILFAVPLQISCSDSGDDNGDSTVVATLEGGADVGKNNSGEIKPSDGKDDSNSGETKPDDGEDDSNPDETRPDGGEDGSNPDETKPDPVKATLAEGVTYKNVDKLMIAVPGKEFSILATEVTQELYESVMGENPSYFKGEKNLPVEKVSWYDAVYFCNKLSDMFGLTPVYAVDGEPDVEKWSYAPHKGNIITGTVSQDENANGYRLPTMEEWQYAAKGGQDYKYSGSDNLDEVGWYGGNSGDKAHPVAQKKPNGYGLYDMSGNVWEWCWDSYSSHSDVPFCGGGWNNNAHACVVGYKNWAGARNTCFDLGFRIVRSTGK